MKTFIVTQGLFPLGSIVITTHARSVLSQASIADGLQAHVLGDWGNVPADDAELNNLAVQQGDRILSAYGESEERYWIITESDRSVTTILMPEDY